MAERILLRARKKKSASEKNGSRGRKTISGVWPKNQYTRRTLTSQESLRSQYSTSGLRKMMARIRALETVGMKGFAKNAPILVDLWSQATAMSNIWGSSDMFLMAYEKVATSCLGYMDP
ncbi:uncharacterized protein EV420DRAFT_1477843 [Desarmillaria tabescens]|uniref:Uncharacterized protein n=1 Tax=Armillaria tabescens TaxID=1929756 RepID=A0AA39N8G9_ARMTA|nr:uncharacterized protein EV420DRAFT_1477843 [Desarmillaria tabescens]KAK0460971.1 hypothetical protein EV420DRAFT_1477843 [Desarmillaria tabescens]